MIEFLPIKTALLSVYDKTKLDTLVDVLSKFKVNIYASDGTYNHLSKSYPNIRHLNEITGFDQLLGGRVKTLNSSLHSAILARKDSSEHMEELKRRKIDPFDLVVVNFYPFETASKNKKLSEDEIIEFIDIGGPTIVRAAAKNFNSVTVISSIEQYDQLIDELEKNSGKVSIELRRKLANQAFQKIVKYDIEISKFFDGEENFTISLPLEKKLRYGENPHQEGFVYGEFFKYFKQIHGKELSYNNILDIISATNLVYEFDEIAAAIIKHNSPCGVAIGNSTLEAYEKALSTDPISAFGGIVAFNKKIDKQTAQKLNEIFLEVIVTPDFEDDVLELLKAKKDRRITKVNPAFSKSESEILKYEFRSIPGGLLVQSVDNKSIDEKLLNTVSDHEPTLNEFRDLVFGFKVAKHVKSNAIVFTKNLKTLGIGAGQTSRLDSVKVAIMKAKEFNHDLNESSVASDGFFPFPDAVEVAANAGATSFIQPGGSVRDKEVIQFVNERKLKMVITNIRHFKH